MAGPSSFSLWWSCCGRRLALAERCVGGREGDLAERAAGSGRGGFLVSRARTPSESRVRRRAAASDRAGTGDEEGTTAGNRCRPYWRAQPMCIGQLDLVL